jgi:prephenate dehydrogenase
MTHEEPLYRPPHREGKPQAYAIVGLGLMGGSLCYAIRDRFPDAQVLGVEPDAGRLDEARRLDVANTYAADTEGLDPSDFDIVFLATPVSVIGPIARGLAARASGHAILIDVGSVKGSVEQAVGDELPPKVTFIGGHPMTGSALDGLEGADPHLYENAVFILTPRDDTDRDALMAVDALLAHLGALVRHMAPDLHDDCVSTISHLPYLVAVAMIEVLQKRHGPDGGRAARLAAGGFHGATRVATCTPSVFRDIVLGNREALLRDVRVLHELLRSFEGALETEDGDELKSRFRSAQVFRRDLPRLRKGILPACPEAIIKARDQPGFIGQVATMIGAARINIRDMEVLHSREGEGGTVRISFENVEARARALLILNAAGFVATERDA